MNEYIKVVYYPGRFYEESKTVMSPVYLEDGSRYDWGFLQRDLEIGHAVFIRQATDEELGNKQRQLVKLKKEFEK